MIIDTGGLLIVLLVLTVPVAIYLLQRGKRSRNSRVLDEIRQLQQVLASEDDLAQAISRAPSEAELDKAMARLRIRRRIADLTGQLSSELRDEIRRGA